MIHPSSFFSSRLHAQLGEEETWARYLQKIKNTTKMLRAFKAEMSQAEL